MADYKKIEPGGCDTGAPLNISRRIYLIGKYIDLHDKYILDGGCGTGDYILEFLKYSVNVFGVEYNEDKVKAFKSSNRNPENVRVGSIEELDFEDGKFDIVLLNEVLEHVSNEKKALEEMKRVLRPGGILVLFSPNRLYPFETHGVTAKRINMSLPHFFPLIPYIPLSLGNRIFNYNSRNYFPWELRKKINNIGFVILDQTFIWQTFENISKKSPKPLLILSPILRRISFTLEKIPFIKMFGVSQVIIAKKPD